MSETKITHAVQQEIINLLHFSPNGTADAAYIAKYLHENMGHINPDFELADWQAETYDYMGDLLAAGIVRGFSWPFPQPSTWTIQTAADFAPYLDALKAAENEQPDVADDREAIDAAWSAIRAEM